MAKLIVAFGNFENAPNMFRLFYEKRTYIAKCAKQVSRKSGGFHCGDARRCCYARKSRLTEWSAFIVKA